MAIQRIPFKCYVDEAGDEGLGTLSSPWFILSAVIVRDDDERTTMDYEQEALKQIWIDYGKPPPKNIHWCKRTHSQKLNIAKLIAPKLYKQIVIGIWKSKLTRPSVGGLGNRSVFYNYACKLLIERISWYVDDRNGIAEIIFSKWGSLDKTKLQAFIRGTINIPNSQIRSVFDVSKIAVHPMDKLVMLRFIDNCVSAFGNALNPDELGNINFYYADLLQHNLYRYRNRVSPWTYGFKIFPDVSLTEFINAYPHTKQWFGLK